MVMIQYFKERRTGKGSFWMLFPHPYDYEFRDFFLNSVSVIAIFSLNVKTFILLIFN